MDMFALRPDSSESFFITEDIYFEKTQRRWPWATETKSMPKQPLYLATCPECKNAIEIRELDRVRGENDRAPMEPFGKHYMYSVPGLGIVYNQAAYDGCSLRGKVTLGSSEHRSNPAFNEVVLKILVEQAFVIRRLISRITGVKVGPTLFDSMMKKFIAESRYKCKGVIPSNIPYAMVYWMESQSIVGQYIFAEDLTKAVNRSKHFRVVDEKILPRAWAEAQAAAEKEGKEPPEKMPWGRHRLAFFLVRRVHKGGESKGEPNRMTLKVTEHENDSALGPVIFTKEISYKNTDFPRAIAAATKGNGGLGDDKKAREDKVKYGEIAFAHIGPLLPDWQPSWKCSATTATMRTETS